jgi:hypothetical protein
MSGVIYLVQGEGKLVPMTEQSYDSEDVLQRLLADYPDLLGGEQMNASAPRRWLLLAREAGLPSEEAGGDRWSVDHLFVDQDGIPTIIEVKRSTDSRIRREVVGQMLDYAANAVVYWPVERLRSRFESLCESKKLDPETALVESLGVEGDVDEFWKLVQTNLQAGRVRLVFVADIIPPELRRIVEFLNAQMNPAEVLAVEVRQYAGQGQQALVPRVIGQTQQAVSQKSSGGAGRETRQWDEVSFMAELSARVGPDAMAAASHLLDWSKRRATRVRFGTGGSDGSFYPRIEHDGSLYTLFTVVTDGRVTIQFGTMKSISPFAGQEKRLELLHRLNQLGDIAIDATRIDLYPSIPISALTSNATISAFLDAFDWVIDEIRAI